MTAAAKPRLDRLILTHAQSFQLCNWIKDNADFVRAHNRIACMEKAIKELGFPMRETNFGHAEGIVGISSSYSAAKKAGKEARNTPHVFLARLLLEFREAVQKEGFTIPVSDADLERLKNMAKG